MIYYVYLIKTTKGFKNKSYVGFTNKDTAPAIDFVKFSLKGNNIEIFIYELL